MEWRGEWDWRSLCTERRLLRTAEHRMGGMGNQEGGKSIYLDEEVLEQEEIQEQGMVEVGDSEVFVRPTGPRRAKSAGQAVGSRALAAGC